MRGEPSSRGSERSEPVADARAADSPAPARQRRTWLLVLALLAAVGLTYARSLQADIQFDDETDILRVQKNYTGDPPPILAMLREGALGNYDRRPLSDLLLLWNLRQGGLEPCGYHVLNLGVHLCVVLALFALVRRTLLLPRFAGRFDESAAWLAFAIALVFGVHPLTTQVATYIVQRSEGLMALFQLLVLWGLARAAAGGRAAFAWVALVWLAGFLGAASKEVMACAPLVALAYDQVFLRGGGGVRRRVAAHVGLWLAVLACLSWMSFFRSALFPAPGQDTDMGLGFSGVTPWRYLLTQCQVVLHYLRLTLWPSGLVIDYGWPFVERPGEVWLEGLVLVALFAASVVQLVRRHWSGFCGTAFFLILAPTSSFVPIADAAFEHRMYLPLAALVALAAGGSLALVRRVTGATAAVPRGWSALWLCAALALALATNARNAVYRSQESMWGDVVAKRPDNARGYTNLSKARRDAGHADKGELARRSVELNPLDPKAHYEVGLACERTGNAQGAREAYERALALDPFQLESHTALGMLLFTRWNDAAGAMSHLQLVAQLAPERAFVRHDIGLVQQRLGKLDQAIASYDQALALDPPYLPSAVMKAACLVSLERLPEAEATLRDALARAETSGDRERIQILANLGTVLLRMRRFAEASECFEQVLALDSHAPGLHVVWHNLGQAREGLGQRDAALAAYRESLALAPDYADSKAALSRLGG